MTIPLNSVPVYVENKFFYDMDEKMTGWVFCYLVGITAYEKQTITFHVVTYDGAMYSDIPIHALSAYKSKPTEIQPLGLKDLAYGNCKDTIMDIFHLEYPKNKKTKCYFPGPRIWLFADYLLTIDFPNSNELFHLVCLENNQYAFVPNHKINFNGEEYLPKFKKSNQTWNI